MLTRILVLLATLLLTACSQPAPPLRIGTNVWIGYEPLYLARKVGLLIPEQAQLVEYTSATQVMDAFADGAIEAAALTLDEALLIQQKGHDARVVLVMDYSHGADALLARPEISNLAALKGKRVGVENTALGAYMLERAIHHAQLPLQDFKVIPMDVHAHERAYLEGKVDAVVTFEPVRGKLLAAGARSLFDSSQIPGEIVDVLIVRANLDASRIAQLRGVLNAWFGALEHLRLRPAESVALMAPRLKLDAPATLKALEIIRFPSVSENKQLLTGPQAKLEQPLSALAKLMVERKLLQPGTPPGSLLDKRLLERLTP